MEIIAGILLFIILVAGIVTFIIARRVLKMAVRLAIVGVVLLIVIVGGAALWYFSTGGSNSDKPANKKPAVLKPAR